MNKKSKPWLVCFWRGVEGIWTPDEDFADPCLTTWPRRRIYNEDCRLNLLFQSATLSVWAGDGIRTHDLLLGKETYYHCTTPAFSWSMISDRECRDPGSNWGHRDFQSRALPTELSRQVYSFVKRPWFYTHLFRLSRKVLSNHHWIIICYSSYWLFMVISI